ncbi:MAG: hypothetical protein KAH20_10635 [Methylococcales bacterium]|nr:hypothetical protein [Methylococcales bacterium]
MKNQFKVICPSITPLPPLLATAIAIITLLPITIRADTSAKIMAYACYTCHGKELMSYNTPTLKLTQQLLAFKNGSKTSTIMERITKGYSNSELQSVATYINNPKNAF